MLNDNDRYRDELANLMNGIADSVLETSDDDIKEEFLEEEDDDVEAIRNLLLRSVTSCRQKNLHQAKRDYEDSLKSYWDTKVEVPDSPEEKRYLIQAMMGSLAAQSQGQLTAQFRELKDTPDEDLDGVLRQLFALQSAGKNG